MSAVRIKTVEAFEYEEDIHIEGDRLLVTNWTTKEPEIVRHFQDAAERIAGDPGAGTLGQELERATKIAVLALKGVQVDTRVDLVEREFLRLMTKMETGQEKREKAIEETFLQFLDEEDGYLAKELKGYLGQGGRLSELFDPNRKDSAVGRIQQLLGEFMEGRGSKLAKMLDVSNPDSPLSPLRDDWRREFGEVRRQLQEFRKEMAEDKAAKAAVLKEAEKGTQKGRSFQETVFDVVSPIASVFGDTVDATWDTAADNGRKAGDVTITIHDASLGSPVRLVIEARDGSCGLTKISRDLADAREARLARIGIGVYSRAEHMPRGMAPFGALGSCDFLVLLDKDGPDNAALQLAYRFARWQAIQPENPDDATVDAEGMRNDVDEARNLLKRVSDVKSKLTQLATTVGKAVEGIGSDAEALRRGLADIFERMDARISCH